MDNTSFLFNDSMYKTLAELNRGMLKKATEASGKNAVVSAASLYLALGIAMNAAGGGTQKEILELIAKDDDQTAFNNQVKTLQSILSNPFVGGKLHLSNGIVLNKSVAKGVKKEFAELLYRYYKAELISGEGNEVLSLINDWVNKNTEGMIPKLLDKLTPDFKMCMMNAIAFEAEWLQKYEAEQIEENEKFKNIDGTTSNVTMLSSSEKIYIDNDLYTGFVKPYKGKYAFMALLPKKAGGRISLRNAIENTDFTEIYKAGNYMDVDVEMPEFEIETTIELEKMLCEMGANTMFTGKADFSGITQDEKLLVNSVIQKSYIKVNREGTKAAAVTAIIECGCVPCFDPHEVVRLDRPFVYAVMEIETGLPVFTGVVNHL